MKLKKKASEDDGCQNSPEKRSASWFFSVAFYR